MYNVVLEPKAKKQLQKLQRKDQERIGIAIQKLAENPFAGKMLEGKLKDLRAVRVWPFRILYGIEKKVVTVFIVAIGHRKDVYLNVR